MNERLYTGDAIRLYWPSMEPYRETSSEDVRAWGLTKETWRDRVLIPFTVLGVGWLLMAEIYLLS